MQSILTSVKGLQEIIDSKPELAKSDDFICALHDLDEAANETLTAFE